MFGRDETAPAKLVESPWDALLDALGAEMDDSNYLLPEGSQSHLGNVPGVQIGCGSLIRGSPDLPILQDGHCIVANDGLQGHLQPFQHLHPVSGALTSFMCTRKSSIVMSFFTPWNGH